MSLKNRAGILACGLLIIGLTMYVSPSTLPSIAPVRASMRTISLVSNYPNWNVSNPNPIITVTKGDTITINLSSGDTLPHQLLIDFDSDYVGGTDCTTAADQCSKKFSPSTPTQLGPFTVTSPAGTYKYYCTIHYPNMQGLFVVQNPPDFGIAANPSSLSIIQGSNGNSTITISSTNNFAGTITLSANASPLGPAPSFGTNPVPVSAGGTATSKLTISIPQTTLPGPYSITVTGTNSSGSPSRSTTINVTVSKPDFSIYSSPTSLTVAPGSSGTTSITLTSMNGFSGTLTLSAVVSPSGPQVSLNPSSVSVTSGGSAPSTLTISTAASGSPSTPVAQGTYSVNVTASIGSLHHSTPVALTVSSTSSPPSAPSLPLLAIAGGVTAAIAVAAVAVFLTRRRH